MPGRVSVRAEVLAGDQCRHGGEGVDDVRLYVLLEVGREEGEQRHRDERDSFRRRGESRAEEHVGQHGAARPTEAVEDRIGEEVDPEDCGQAGQCEWISGQHERETLHEPAVGSTEHQVARMDHVLGEVAALPLVVAEHERRRNRHECGGEQAEGE